MGEGAGDGGDGAERGKGGLEVGEGFGGEVAVAVGGEEGAVDLAFGKGGEDGGELCGEGVGRGGESCGRSRQEELGDLSADLAGGGGGDFVGKDDDGELIVGVDDVFGDVAADLAGVLEFAVAVAVFNAKAEGVVGGFAVGEGKGGFHLSVAGGREEGLVHEGDVPR